MKPLAILKDSFREALDSKVFYVLAGLSLVLTLLIASASFRPVPAETALATIVGQFPLVHPDRGRSVLARYFPLDCQVRDVRRLNEGTDPATGRYRFTVTIGDRGPPFPSVRNAFRKAVVFWNRPPDPGSFGKDEDPGPVPDGLMEEFLRERFATESNLEVAHVTREKDDGDKLRFTVQTDEPADARGWLHEPCLFFGSLPLPFLRRSLGRMVYWTEDTLVNGIGAWVAVMIGVVVTAFFIPNMLRKGSVDLLLAKPIRRPTLLVYKYLGGLTFVFLNTAVAVFGVWLALGLRSGIWAAGFLLTVLLLSFFFAILYAVSALFAVLTRSAVVAILLTFVAWFVFFLVGTAHVTLETLRAEPLMRDSVPNWVYSTVDVAHAALPRTKDLDVLTTRLLSAGVLTEREVRKERLDRLPAVSWGESLTVSGGFIALMLGLACWRFATRDY
jgi:ABC-type transport system involved in multi-copper enzyme maturation permease subunit